MTLEDKLAKSDPEFLQFLKDEGSGDMLGWAADDLSASSSDEAADDEDDDDEDDVDDDAQQSSAKVNVHPRLKFCKWIALFSLFSTFLRHYFFPRNCC